MGLLRMKWQKILKKAGKTFYVVGNRTNSKAVDFAEKHAIGKVYDDFHARGLMTKMSISSTIRRLLITRILNL